MLGLSTSAADYYLGEASEAYRPLLHDLNRKVFITKLTVERLMRARDELEPLEYDEMLQALEARKVPGQDAVISTDDVIKYSDFIVSQV